jgi:high frequency lysogenization protein
MIHSIKDRTLALAGIFQAAGLVQTTARFGNADVAAVRASLESVLRVDADSVEQVFGGMSGVVAGLRILIERLDRSSRTRDLEVTRYVIGLMHLERKLLRRPEMLEALGKGISAIASQTHAFSDAQADLATALGQLYQDTLSTVTPRIIVHGEPKLLADPVIASQIRALLLAGIRATVLWRQCGGTRFQLLWSRSTILEQARVLLQTAGSAY